MDLHLLVPLILNILLDIPKSRKVTCDTCDGSSSFVEIPPALFHFHLFGTLVVVFVQHVHTHVHPVVHGLLGYISGSGA